ncbi:hypothetical protein [Arcobacter roscoffensis]|uniref:Uncharacterized protein n=1 Tax=Arcobacter roscoffensis TaxID=2961520 RepID=A0ABY5E285_9BACT|nr:hypothetical protein [Arcobacter roscoffensis]UTJ06302.1 hypothetical protein NJU99_13760 [Arcobacter roscoffensis]
MRAIHIIQNDPDTPNEKDNVNVKLVGVDTDVTEGESATYKVTLTDDAGQPVVTTEDLTVDFTYTYTTAEGEDITEDCRSKQFQKVQVKHQ